MGPSLLRLVIANKNYSSWSLRPWVLLKESQMAFEEIMIPLGQESTPSDIAQFSGSGRLPVLLHTDIRLWESLAICEYIAEIRALRTALWPRDAGEKAWARSISSEMHAGFASMRAELPMNIRKQLAATPPLSEGAKNDLQRIVKIWTDCRRAHAAKGPYLFGDTFGVADAMFAPVAFRMSTYAITPSTPEAQSYLATLLSLPSMKEWKTAALAEPYRLAKYE